MYILQHFYIKDFLEYILKWFNFKAKIIYLEFTTENTYKLLILFLFKLSNIIIRLFAYQHLD